MPLVYADTSALFAFFHPRDEFSAILTEAARKHSPDFVYWSFMRYELRHNLRQARVDSYGEVAWKALRAAERTQARLRWQPDLKCDSVLESAGEFSAQRALEFAAGRRFFARVSGPATASSFRPGWVLDLRRGTGQGGQNSKVARAFVWALNCGRHAHRPILSPASR